MSDKITSHELWINHKNAREKLGLTQLELAKELDCSDAYITKIEKGERIPAEELIESMAGALHLDRNEMMRLALKESNPKIYSAFRMQQIQLAL